MRHKPTERYCADPQALAALKRDGMGWGHDLDADCFEAPRAAGRRPFVRRVQEWFGKGI